MATALAQTIRNAARLKGWTILAYQIMPNHVHLLTMKNDRAATESRAWGILKNYPLQVSAPAVGENAPAVHISSAVIKPATISGYMYTLKSYYLEILRKHNDIHHSIWQPRFYSRIVNTEKYLATVVEYIQHNPVKDSLPARYSKPPYQYFNWRKIKEAF